MTWHVTSVEQFLWVSAGKSRQDAADIEKGLVVAVACNSELDADEIQARYLVSAGEKPPRWVDAADVTASGVQKPEAAASAPDATNWLPIKKVGGAILGAALAWVALRLGVDLGPDALNEAATAVVGLLVAYFVRDPRVR